MANSIQTYTDEQIMKCLLTKDFSLIGGEFIDDIITQVKQGAFCGATNLTKVSLPSVKNIYSAAFQNTDAELDLPWEELEGIGIGAFLGATGVPENLTLSKLTALSNAAFAGTSSVKNTALRTVSLPLWTGSSFSETYGVGGSGGSFAYCSALTSFSAPSLQSIPSGLLNNCAAIEELKFPKATTIASGAFNNCTKLKKLEIGGAVTRISTQFLNGSSAITTFILSGVTSVPTLSSSSFNSSGISANKCYIYVPQSLETAFKVASVWSNYSSMIRAIEDYPDECGS
jgi:hypothetical protein